jgi:exodeoxyribonuclease VII large subunit
MDVEVDREHELALALLHNGNGEVFKRTALDPAAFVANAAAAMRVAGPTAVGGECRAIRSWGGNFSFSLCARRNGKVEVIDARIDAVRARKISRYLRSRCDRTLSDYIVTGSEVTLDGSIRLDPISGQLYLDVERVGPQCAQVGNLARWDLAGREALVELGVSRHRMSDRFAHHRKYSAKDIPWPAEFARVVGISSKTSQGGGDLARQLHGSGVEYIHDSNVRMEGKGAAASIVRAIERHAEVDSGIIVLARGGGGVSALSIFDEFDIARAIVESEVPVFTAIGHSSDMTLADRAAAASFDTPTVAGAVLRARVASLNKARTVPRITSAYPAKLPEIKRDVIDGTVHRKVMEELRTLRAERARVTEDYGRLLRMYQKQLHLSGYQRIQLRSRALFEILTAVFLFAVAGSTAHIGEPIYWALAMAGCVAGAIFVLRGPRRAVRYRTPGRLLSAEQWYVAAECAATPRRFRSLWPNWPKPERSAWTTKWARL